MTMQLSLYPEHAPTAQVRQSDPSSSVDAARKVDAASQLKILLARLHDGPVTADEAGELIGRHRSIASARLGVMVNRGLAVPDGYARKGMRKVLRYRLTDAGRVEFARMFGNVQ